MPVIFELRRMAPAFLVLLSASSFASPVSEPLSQRIESADLHAPDSRLAIQIAQAALPDGEVEQMQMTLNALGFHVGEADGVMGSRTRTALLAFQSAYGVPQTGMLDDPTRRALVRAQSGAMERLTSFEDIDAPRAVQAYHHNLLEEEIADVQTRLNSAGYDAGAPDGEVTDQMRQALADFQRDQGLPVSGLVGPDTWEALQLLPAQPAGSSAGIEF